MVVTAPLGEAGVVVTDDAALAGRVRRRRNCGSQEKRSTVLAGVNSRLDELHAALKCVKLSKDSESIAD